MKASDYIAAFLAEQGVTTVYEMTGGMITHLLDSLHRRDDIRIVSVHHEQSAAFAAEGGARMTGIPGVAMATSGPGATNLITGIGSCFFDSVPAVFITGQVNTQELRGASGVRQAGFQETDIVTVAGPLTKAALQVSSAADVPGALATAFRIALEGRPGPVLLDIPMNVQSQELDASLVAVEPSLPNTPLNIDEVLYALSIAERPLILAGGGVRAAGSSAPLRHFAESIGVPVASSLMGLDVLPGNHPLRVGLIGTYGNRWANLTLRDADCVLVLGARLDVRQTGADTEAFHADKLLIQIDIDSDQLRWRIPADIQVLADMGDFLAAAIEHTSQYAWPERAAWRERIADYKRDWPDTAEIITASGISPAETMHAMSARFDAASAYVADVGQNQMWAAQSLALGEDQRFLTSGGMGAMGFALPTAVGVTLAVPGRPVVAIAGDGGMQVNIQELETIARLGLPIKIVVLNNGCLGMVRQFQEELFESRYQSTVWGYGVPDFVAVGKAYGIDSKRVGTPSDLDSALDWLAHDPSLPGLLDVAIDVGASVRPKVSYGSSIFAMEPAPSPATTRPIVG